MDKTAIKKFAIESRKKLINEIKLKAEILGITADGVSNKLDISTPEVEYYIDDTHPITGSDISKRQQLVKELSRRTKKNDFPTAFKDLVEEVAYTWFNRIIAIRFMEVNDYLPSRTNVLSSTQNRNEPDIMIDPLSIESDLGGFSESEKALIEKASDTLNPNDMDDLYHMLFIKQANALNKNLPYLFEKTNNYAELLFTPNYHNGVIKHLIDDVNVDDFDVSKGGQVEIIGWLYQYYNTEPHDEVVNISGGAVKKSDIPAATQLFTTDWVVRYMVDNSLGKYWLERHQDSGLSDKLKYLLPGDIKLINDNENIEDIKVIDNAMGSGHILVYAFDVLMDIYLEEGYSARDAAVLILTKNLYGLEIDTRAYQLSYFALMMKVRQYNRRALRTEGLTPNVYVFEDTDDMPDELIDQLTGETGSELKEIIDLYSNARELGSIIDLPNKDYDFKAIRELLNSLQMDALDVFGTTDARNKLLRILDIVEVMCAKYDIAVTNPPYMNKFDKELKKYVKKHYPNYSGDMFSIFIYNNINLVKEGGYSAYMTPFVWMFIKRYEELRNYIVNHKEISSLIQMEYSAFEEATVPINTFVLKNFKNEEKGTYIKLSDFKGGMEVQKDKVLEAIYNTDVNYLYRTNQANFSKIPGMPIAYWASANLLHDFEIGTRMDKIVDPRQGLATADNNRFLRQWFEVNNSKISYHSKSIADSLLSGKKWFPLNKGGSYRKWYGNYDYVVNWENDGMEIKNFKDSSGKVRSRPQNTNYYFREAITWSDITSGGFSMRYREFGSIHNNVGMSAFSTHENLLIILGLMNTPIGNDLFKLLNPTIHLEIGDFKNFPVIESPFKTKDIPTKVKHLISISKLDWDAQEVSWNFCKNNLINNNIKAIESSVIAENKRITEAREEMASIETGLNKEFINLYKLDDELDYHVDPDEVTLVNIDITRDIKGLLSYFVGLVFGRYSLDKDGLIYSGDNWHDSNYVSFKPNKDNIILLNDDKYFDDDRDIINRLKEFLSVAFDENTVKENMEYIASIVGKKADTPEDSIRKYFVEEFFKDHKQMYKKRPIYWELSSGKNDGFKALIYLHRYDEDEFAMVRTDYIHPLQGVYELRLNQLQKLIDVEESIKTKKQLDKSIKHLSKQLDEIKKYDIVMQHVANQKISLDLDDGVLANFDKIQSIESVFSKIK
ncbi:BREX-1 system adenine-specific DNA-methyltransferase PglX [Companilactobacillus hulinensis]|uniref:BREX-1 system adenine-specific DNA-methyltransferase PglX n=1 Tax=Companilactobacillus hulinensis TaxID=2486007 RepID=UPI000F78E4EC|nr:BREX-1 system adenine-specific DNA-methyltransferase PglX [Companilactobacillus hulinensis]